MYGIHFGLGIQRLVDAQQSYQRAGGAVYLRIKNSVVSQTDDVEGLGFQETAASGTIAGGTTDILITPPPSVSTLSIGSIGMSGGHLRIGARSFLISGTFVRAVIAELGFTSEMELWRSGLIVGLVTDGMLFAIVGVPSGDDVAGTTVTWSVLGNAPENLFVGA